MKKIILSILFIAFVFASIGQNLKGYYVEAYSKLEAKRAFVIDLDTFYATTQLNGLDTILVSLNYVTQQLATKEPANANIQQHITSDADLSITNEIQSLTRIADSLKLTNSLGVDLSDYAKDTDLGNYIPKVTSTDNAIARFNGTTGDIQNSGVILNDNNIISSAAIINAQGISNLNVNTNSYYSNRAIYYDTYFSSALNKPFSGNNANGVLTLVSYPSEGVGAYGKQIAFGDNNNLYIRRFSNGTFENWVTLYHSGNSNLPTVNWTANNINTNNITAAGTIQGTTAKFTNLTDGYLPYHISDESGLANSPLFTNGTRVGLGTNNPASLLHLLNTSGATRLTIESTGAVVGSRADIIVKSQLGDAAFRLNSESSEQINYLQSSNYAINGNRPLYITGANGAQGSLFKVDFSRMWITGNTLINTSTDNSIDKLQVNGSILGTTAKLTNLTDNYIIKHTSDATGLENSNIFFSGNIARYGTANTFSNDRDIPDKAYVDAIASGNMPKLPVDAATTGNITLSGTQTIDGYSAVVGSRILVWKQTTTSQNGVYIVASGAWTRATDLDTWAELYKAYVTVLNGAQSGSSFVCTVPSSGTLGTDPVTWILYNAPTNITVSSPLAKSGNNISLGYDTNTLDVASNLLKVKDNTFQPLSSILTNTTASFTTALETKLNGIEAGAEVNVNADWNATSGDAQILNKPTALSQFTNDLGNYGGFLTTETDPIFAADSAKILHWSDTLNLTKGIASQYDLTTGLATKQNTLTTGNLTENVTGLQFDATRQVVGGAAQLSLTSGYIIPTTTEQTNWTAGYNDKVNSLAFSGTTTKTLTLTQQDGGTVSNTFTDLDVQTLTADSTTTTIGITASGSNSRVHFNVDKSATNELQNLSKSKTGNNVTVNISSGTGTTFSVADSDSLTTNELNNSVTWNNTTNELTVNDAGGNKTATITGFLESEVDGSITNEGSLTVAAGTSTTSIINSNTSGQTGVTLSVDGTNLGISETGNTITLSNLKPDQTVSLTGGGITNVSGTYPSFTITSNEVDGSTTNELQTLSKDSVNITNGKRYGISISSGNRITVTDMDSYPGSSWASTTNNSTNWNTAYTDRNKWDGGATGLVAATGRTSLGGTTVGQNIFTSTNPSAITFLRANADNTVSWLDAATFRTAIGAGTSSTNGTVTSVAMTVPTGLSISGTPITTSGTLAVTLTSGYSIPTTTNQTNWNTAYSWGNHASQGYLTQSLFNSGNPDLAAIEALAGTTGLLRKTAANTWSLDNNIYLTSYTETDPIWTSASTNYYTKTNLQTSGQASVHWDNITNEPTFLTSYTETDPIFNLHTVKNIINGTGFLKNNGSGVWSWDNSTYLTGNQTITISGDASGSGTTAITLTVADDSHNHNGTTISGLSVADFTSPNISNWTNDANYADKDLANTFLDDQLISKASGVSALKIKDSESAIFGALDANVGYFFVRNGAPYFVNGDFGSSEINLTPSPMIYPSAGIAVSTGSAWGTSITDNSTNWNTAYNDKINSLAFSGTTTKTLTLTQQDGGTVTGTFTDNNTYTSLASLGGLGTSGSDLYLSFTNVSGGTPATTGYFMFHPTGGTGAYAAQFSSLNVNILGSGAATSGYVPTANGTGGITWSAPASSYTLPLAANGTIGGIQIGYTETASNRAVKLSSEKAYVTLPDATTAAKGVASFSSTNFSVSSGAVSIASSGITALLLANNVISGQVDIGAAIVDTDEMMISDGGTLRKTAMSRIKTYINAGSGTVTSVAAGNGMNFTTITGSGSVTLGTPSTLGGQTTNAVTTTSHTHALSFFGTPSTGSYLGYDATYNIAWKTAGSNTQVLYNSSGTISGSASFTFNSGTGAVTATNFVLSSDKRLKKGIRPLTNLEWVDDISFKQFRMKEYDEQLRYGVIAQEVEKVNSELVNTSENGYKSVNYIDLLVAKVARQDEVIKTQENVISSLIERIEKLEKANN